jgi:hypothetical protein
MSKPLLKWENVYNTYRAKINGYRLEAAVSARPGDKQAGIHYYGIRTLGPFILEGEAPTLELAQVGAEEALRRYLKANGRRLYDEKMRNLMDEQKVELDFVMGRDQE